MTKSSKKPPKDKGKKKPPKERKRGGQPGNKNALRHGFYSSNFKDEELEQLDGQDSTDLIAEIKLLRVFINRLVSQVDFDPIYLKSKDENGAPVQSNVRDDHYLKQLNTLGLMTTSVSTLTRTNYLVKGKGADITDSIERALEEIRLEMGL